MSPQQPPAVLFVCLGNICRSPLAEGIFLHLARRHGLEGVVVDSAGTGDWHAGEGPDPRALAVARRRGVHLPSIARQVRAPEDFERFTHLVPMDASNLARLLDLGAPPERVRLMRAYDPAHAGREAAPDVPDPYSGGDEGFERVFDMLEAACRGLVGALREGA